MNKCRILFVCLGNICRSPTAHGVFESKAKGRGILAQLEIDSAGTAAWHEGKSPDARSSKHAKIRGYDLSRIRARQVCPQDFSDFDFIFAMDQENLINLKSICPLEHQHKLALFLTLIDRDLLDVPDPYYGGEKGFEHVLDLVEAASDALLDSLSKSF